MRRFFILIPFLAVTGLLPIGCGNSPTTAKSTLNTTATATPAFTYPFSMNVGQYMDFGQIYNSYCATWDPIPGQFYDVTGVAVNSDYLFIADDSESDIQMFDIHGRFIAWFYPCTSTGYRNISPKGMKTDNKGHLYVADYDWSTIDVYNINDIVPQTAQTATCNEVYAYASYGNTALSKCPTDVDVDTNGNMYVADPCYGGVYVLAPDFNYSTEPNEGTDVTAYTIAGTAGINNGYLSYPHGIAADPTGQNVYVSDANENVIQVYNGMLSSVGFIGDSSGAASTLLGQFDYPSSVRLDNQGNLMVADTDNGRVQRLTTGGKALNVIGASGPVQGDLYSPVYLAVDAGNNLYVSDNNVATVDIYSPQ